MNTEGGKLLQVYLMTSFAYYHLGRSLIPDEQFDKMAKRLLDIYDTFDHQHKHLVTKGDLEAGTLFHLKWGDYPMMVKQAAMMKLKDKGLI